MSDNRSVRIKANVSQDQVLNVNLEQDIDTLELLSLKIDASGVYKFHTSDYGCIAGRVLANGNFGIPNAKISIFIAATEDDLSDNIVSYLYPYTSVRTKNSEDIRYNLLPEEQIDECHRNVGSFPSKRMVLDDDNVLEIYDKYYKFTTRSNEAGDYMIFGVPTGEQTIHVDIDLSDIGILSQKPRDLVYKGYNITQFENASMFKKSSNLDNLTQIITQNATVYVYPFWGEESESEIAITRKDIEIQYEFQPTCIFIGSVVADETSNAISKTCIPSERSGKMDRLVAGEGTIEMIRKTPQGDVEEIFIQGDSLIDGNGTWCYQIPMNLDYVRTDEYGKIVPTDDPKKGIPTRARMRFRFSLNDTEGGFTHLPKILVPNNPQKYEDIENTYVFGSNTDDDKFATKGFRDLFWNNVYTVKSYIPRIQQGNFNRNRKFSGMKAVNINGANNPIPYNNMRVDLTFMFALQCAIFKVILFVVGTVNRVLNRLAQSTIGGQLKKGQVSCLYIGDGYCPNLEGYYFAPGCPKEQKTWEGLYWTVKRIKEKDDIDGESVDSKNGNDEDTICVSNNVTYFVQCVEISFAQQYDVIQFDFYNDWINGMLYMPRWYAEIKPKRTFLFGLIKIKPRVNACIEGMRRINTRRYVQQCALSYQKDGNGFYTRLVTQKGCVSNGNKQRCHKSSGRKYRKILKGTKGGGGLVHQEMTMQEKNVYYLRPCEWVDNNNDYGTKCNLFATDIVLIGSVNKYNLMGIPQSFEKLESSSYQMPDTLASTNIGVDGFFYGFSKENTKCSGKQYTQNELEQYNSSKDLLKWSADAANRDDTVYRGDEVYDSTDYSITEASGIDWGYWGPNQDKNIGDGGVNNIDRLYFPGGHFLGISCGVSEVNVKSCVNLSRICEVGSVISQRKGIIRRSGDTSNYIYSYLIPTGLISKDDINDYGFKNEFATLNHNRLRTKINKDTNMLEYDFSIVHPVNFNGELESYTRNYGYNNPNGFSDNADVENYTEVLAYRRTVEENSSDYYRFRMGYHGGEAKNKYLIVSGSTVSLPMYENSYYFYFGIKNGATALDRFNTEFYAQCPGMSNYNPEVIIKTKGESVCVLNDGEITAITKNMEGTIEYSVYDSERTLVTSGRTLDGEFYVSGLSAGDYTIEMTCENIESQMSRDFQIVSVLPSVFKGINPDAYPFKREFHFTVSDPSKETYFANNAEFQSSFGYVEFNGSVVNLLKEIEGGGQITGDVQNILEIFVAPSGQTGTKYAHWVYIKPSHVVIASEYTPVDYGEIEYTGLSRCSVWEDGYYNVFAVYACGEEGQTPQNRTFKIGEFIMQMPHELDLLFNGSSSITYNKVVKELVSKYYTSDDNYAILKDWYKILLDPNYDSEKHEYIKNYMLNELEMSMEDYYLMFYELEKALFYQGSVSEIDSARGSINIKASYGTPPYIERIDGDAETLREVGDRTYLSFAHMSTSQSIDNFLFPTEGAPVSDYGYFCKWTISGGDGPNKLNYSYSVRDASNGSANSIPFVSTKSLALPSIYRPFYFNAVFHLSYNSGNTIGDCRYRIFNGVTMGVNSDVASPHFLYGAVCNGAKKTSGLFRYGFDYPLRENVPYINPLDIETQYPFIEGKFSNLVYMDNDYSLSVSEISGSTIEESMHAPFVGFGNGYNPIVKYYEIKGEDIYNTLKGCMPSESTIYIDASLGQWNLLTESLFKYLGTAVVREIKPSDFETPGNIYITPNYLNTQSPNVRRYVVGIVNSFNDGSQEQAEVLNSICTKCSENTQLLSGVIPADREIMKMMGDIYPRHRNCITAMMFYTPSEFNTICHTNIL